LGRESVNLNSPEAGNLFESNIYHELCCFKNYREDISLHYWRSTSNFEVDFILNEKVAVEVKLTKNVTSTHLKGLRAIKEENILKRYILISQDKQSKVVDGIELMYWADFITLLWEKKIL